MFTLKIATVARIFGLVILSGFGVACLGFAAAAYTKSTSPLAAQSGHSHDYIVLAIMTAFIGTFLLSIAVWLLKGLFRPKAPAPVTHF